MQLVLHEDDLLHVRRNPQHRLELGQQLVRRNDHIHLGLVDPVRNALIPQRRVNRHQRHVLLEAPVRRNQPLRPRLREDHNVLPRLLPELAQTPPEAGRRELRLDKVAPHVVAHLELLEDAPVRLHLVLLTEDLARADAPLRRVDLRHEVEHPLQGVDVVLQHLDVHLAGRVHAVVCDRGVVLLDDLGLRNGKEKKELSFVNL